MNSERVAHEKWRQWSLPHKCGGYRDCKAPDQEANLDGGRPDPGSTHPRWRRSLYSDCRLPREIEAPPGGGSVYSGLPRSFAMN